MLARKSYAERTQRMNGDDMRYSNDHPPRRGAGSLARGATLAVMLVGTLAACESLLDVDAASRIPAANLQDPVSANLLLNGAIGDFECAFNSYTVLGGILGEEFIDATQTADRWPYDRREVLPSDARYAEFGCTSLGVYTPLSTARWAAENVLSKLEGWTDAEVDDRTEKIAAAATYAGYSNLLLGEGFCSGVILDADLEPGGEVTRDQVLQRAEERFTRAIQAAEAANDDVMLNTALVGRARTRLNLGNLSDAAADARRVEADFEQTVSASTIASRRENRVYQQNNQSQAVSVGVEYRNVTWAGVPDPRVPVVDAGRTSSDGTPIWVQEKYTGLETPLPLATWDEAQLIIAEAEGGQTAVDIINMFHLRAGIPPFLSLDENEIQAHVVEERRRELFLESHHLGDIIRYGLELEPATGTPFSKGGTYGTTTCLPLPDVERLNNPRI